MKIEEANKALKLEGKRIFIVEDNSHNRIIYQVMLVKARARVSFERRGRNTVQIMKERGKYDLIILDLMLAGGISGFDIFKEIRAEPDFDGVPIVAVSAAEPAMAIPKAQELGFDGFITKPIDDDLFPGQLAAIIDGEKIWYAGDMNNL